jgi:hypothetical protein
MIWLLSLDKAKSAFRYGLYCDQRLQRRMLVENSILHEYYPSSGNMGALEVPSEGTLMLG